MKIEDLINKEIIDNCKNDDEALKVLTDLRSKVTYTSVGYVDPRPFSDTKRKYCEDATLAAMRKEYLNVLKDIYYFLYCDATAESELSDSESAVINLILIIVEEESIRKE